MLPALNLYLACLQLFPSGLSNLTPQKHLEEPWMTAKEES